MKAGLSARLACLAIFALLEGGSGAGPTIVVNDTEVSLSANALSANAARSRFRPHERREHASRRQYDARPTSPMVWRRYAPSRLGHGRPERRWGNTATIHREHNDAV